SAMTPRLPDADLRHPSAGQTRDLPVPVQRAFHTCQGLRPRRAGRPLALTRPSMSPSVILTTSAPDTFKLSRLDGWPMRSPTDASTQPSRIASRGLGPMRFATPSSWRTFTTYSLPVLPAHQNSRIMTKRLLLENRGLLRETRKDGVSEKKLRGSDRNRCF